MIYAPEQFTVRDQATLLQLIRKHNFATLVSARHGDPVVAHVPVLSDEDGQRLECHVARANPLWRNFSPDEELLFIFHGPHHYVSPAWYSGELPSVPTWNYATVHVHAIPTIVDDQKAIESMLRRLVAKHETAQGTQWAMDLPTDYLRKMIDGIVAFEARITRMEGKFKLSQNRPLADQRSVIAALKQTGGDEASDMAELMQKILKH